jgi:hypothetical protein
VRCNPDRDALFGVEAGSQTFAFSNTLLTRLGIDRRTKYWVLESLEAAGKVKVEHPGSGRAPIVTLLTPSRGVA